MSCLSNTTWIGNLSSTSTHRLAMVHHQPFRGQVFMVIGKATGLTKRQKQSLTECADQCLHRSETRTTSERGRLRRTAERAWQSLYSELGLPVHTFRLGGLPHLDPTKLFCVAGIYGPGRSLLNGVPSRNALRRVTAQYTNRCHVYDVCQV